MMYEKQIEQDYLDEIQLCKQEIAELDPVDDAERIASLWGEIRKLKQIIITRDY